MLIGVAIEPAYGAGEIYGLLASWCDSGALGGKGGGPSSGLWWRVAELLFCKLWHDTNSLSWDKSDHFYYEVWNTISSCLLKKNGIWSGKMLFWALSALFIVLWSCKLNILLFALQMDPVQKAVINHTFGVSIPPKKKQVISCNVCQLRFNSDVSIVIFFLAVRLINPNIFSQLNPLQFCPHLCQPFTMTFCPLAREFVMASHTVIFNFFWYVVVYMLTLSCLTMTATTRVNLPKEQKDLASNLRLLSVVWG